MDFSVMFFGAGETVDAQSKYQQVLDVARAVDGSDIGAIWTPERHYHSFGGMFPQPAVLSAAIAVATKHLRIRAGSVVAPLHRAVEIVEQWALVDALSGGRVDLALASGWNSVDFWTTPESFENRHRIVEESFAQVHNLWAGRSFTVRAPDGVERDIRAFPTPVQSSLALSLAASGGRETFLTAGRLGAGVLTHLLGQSMEDLAANIAAYREAHAAGGHDPAAARVAVMLHTHLGDDPNHAATVGTVALTDYLQISIDLDLTNRPGAKVEPPRRLEMASLRAQHYVEHSALIGGFEGAVNRLSALGAAGVDEVAFLLDFGVPAEAVVPQARLLVEWVPMLRARLKDGCIAAREIGKE